MLAIRSILCPIDFSEQSRDALVWASVIGKRHSSQITVLTVVDPTLAQVRGGFDAEPALREFVGATLPEPVQQDLKLRIEVQVGNASERILETSRRKAPDLIVMGTQGLGRLRRLMLGSTTQRVLRGIQRPLLAIPKGARTELDASHSPADHLKRILVATDFREGSSVAVPWAAELARDLAVPLVFVHVVQPVVVPKRWRRLVEGADEQHVALAQRQLERLSTRSGAASTKTEVSLGEPAERISSLARMYDAGLIVMGLSNRQEADNARGPGAIACRVLSTAHVAILVVPPQ
jgi:nucleotide-binding universal stress UspA family protein